MSDLNLLLSNLFKYNGSDYESYAERLSQVYPSFSSIAQTDYSIISEQCNEKNAVMLRILSALASRRIVDKFKLGVAHTEEELFEFLKGVYFDIVNETVLILPLDSKNRIIAVEYISEGTVNFSGIVPRKILEILLKYKSSSAILVHNHPNGKAVPSIEDVETTKIVAELLRSADKKLVCHYVVAGNDVCKVDTSCSLKDFIKGR